MCLALQREVHFCGIAKGISQGVLQFVGTLFVDFQESIMLVECLQHAELVARFYERLHVLPLAPRIDVAILLVGEVIYGAAEHSVAIYCKGDELHPIFIVYGIHIVVGLDAYAYQPPNLYRLLRIQWKSFLCLTTIYHPLSWLWKEHEAFGLRSRMVLHFIQKERQWVHVFIFCIEEVEMQVRTERVTRIAAAGYLLPCLNRIFFW